MIYTHTLEEGSICPMFSSSSCDVKHVILSLTVYVKVYYFWQTYSWGSVRACRYSEIDII